MIYHKQGFIQQREKGDIPPLDFRPSLFQHATTSQLQAFWGPEATLEGLNFKHFLGEHIPTLSRNSVLHMIDSFPSLTKKPGLNPAKWVCLCGN